MSEENLQSTRPTFLTVLCILTFIGSGLGVIGNLLGLAGSAALASFSTGGGAMWSVVGLAASGLCLYGAIQMWGLKKQGFMLYAAGVGISILTSIIVPPLNFKKQDHGSWLVQDQLFVYSLLRACQSFCVPLFVSLQVRSFHLHDLFYFSLYAMKQRNLKIPLHTYHNIEDCFLVNSPLSFLPLGGHLKHQGHTQILSHL